MFRTIKDGFLKIYQHSGDPLFSQTKISHKETHLANQRRKI